jgi:hypothetical protein
MIIRSVEPEGVYRASYGLSVYSIEYNRAVYNVLDLMGDIGGVLEIIVLFFGIFLNPISKFSFDLTAIRYLYLVRTSEKDLFDNKKVESDGEKEPNPDGDAQVVKLRKWDRIALYFAHSMGSLFPKKCWSKRKKLLKMLEEGNDKVEASMDLAHHITKFRNNKILLENSLLTKEVRKHLKAYRSNIINLDSEDEENDEIKMLGDEARS